MKHQLTINGQEFAVDIAAIEGGVAKVTVNGKPYEVMFDDNPRSVQAAPVRLVTPVVTQPTAAPVGSGATPAAPSGGGGEVVTAPIPGIVIDITVSVGAKVAKGDTVAVLEAMKMENNLVAQSDGTVAEIRVQKGQQVSTGEVLLRIA